jgi:fatty-acyl-CoA synthase
MERAALVYGERVGVVDEPEQVAPSLGALTYSEVWSRARALAAGLESLGVPEGGRVAVVSQNAARLLDVLFGAPAHGRVAVPVNFRLHPDEVSYIVEHSGAEVLLVDPELEEHLEGVAAPQKFVIGAETDGLLYRHDVEPTPWTPDEDATATINYTSGTTARPGSADPDLGGGAVSGN